MAKKKKGPQSQRTYQAKGKKVYPMAIKASIGYLQGW